MKNKKTKILLGQLNNLGDCLLATTVAKQIKYDYPNSILTWAIRSCCKHVVDNNLYVDEIWEIPLFDTKQENVLTAWKDFTKEAEIRKAKGDFDLIFYTQYSYGHLDNYMGVTRASIFAGYPKKIRVPIAPVLSLTDLEVENVKTFAVNNQLHIFKKIILFECIGNTGQSFLTDDFIYNFCRIIVNNHPDICLILSSNKKIDDISGHNLVDGSALSFRENAELTKYCSLFIGVSSGITWLCTSAWAKDLPKVILIDKTFPQASVILDHAYFNIHTNSIFEINQCTPEELVMIINSEPLQNTEKNEQLFEHLCFYSPAAYYLENRNYYRIVKLFLKAPTLKIKRNMLKFFTERYLKRPRSFLKGILKAI